MTEPKKPMSYAGRLEDALLALVLADVTQGFYVDVGGGHPVADNVSLLFYERGWRGIVVEPQAELAATTRAVRPRDIVFEGIAGRTEGSVTFHRVEHFHGFSTMIAEHAALAASAGARIVEERVASTTLASLLARHAPPVIDFLKIDVEGAEADVIAGNDWARFRPKVLVIEAVAPGTMAPAWDAFEPMLLGAGYRFAFFDELNRYYVAQEHAGLVSRFPAAPLPWDAYDHLWDHGRAHVNAAHMDHALASALAYGLMARLPHLDPGLLAELASVGSAVTGAPAPAIDAIALGRIACAYDGGHLME